MKSLNRRERRGKPALSPQHSAFSPYTASGKPSPFPFAILSAAPEISLLHLGLWRGAKNLCIFSPLRKRFLKAKPFHPAPISRSFPLVLVLLLSGIAASAQTVTVRLYSLHTEHHIRLTARSASLSWKTCEQCKANPAPELLIAATGK